MNPAINAEITVLAADLTGHLVEMEARIASGEVTHPGIIALARQIRATLDLSRDHGTA